MTEFDGRVKCNNCDWTGDVGDVEPYRDFWSRIEAGEIVPVGDCPKCGAFAHYSNPSQIYPWKSAEELRVRDAAPDLLAALQYLVGEVEDGYVTPSQCEGARAAIAKAQEG